MLINNLDKLIGLVGVCIGIEIIAGLIGIFAIIYVRNPYMSGVIASMSSMSMSGVLIYTFLKREPTQMK